jgi:hypothetical protein
VKRAAERRQKVIPDQNSFEFPKIGSFLRKNSGGMQKLRVHFELKMHFSALFVLKTTIFDTRKNGLKCRKWLKSLGPF